MQSAAFGVLEPKIAFTRDRVQLDPKADYALIRDHRTSFTGMHRCR